MKKYILPSIRLTAVLLVLLCVVYPLAVAFAARFAPGAGGGEKLQKDGKVVGYERIGQVFDKPGYFWGRPSAVSYNAAGSAGSNKGPSNPDYLKQVADRVDTLLKYHPGLKKADIPADLVTASGSGLDPEISEQAARIQVSRVAKARGLDKARVAKVLAEHTEGPVFGLFGPATVHVLKLNLALDGLQK
ncbi:potassium-transporting ATPase subunit C [Pedobacter yulinensis]|uniref:Potassium-transporting ATPase KdpC subunit n=1 Tax=Pedobacter yulinensis TaxID=2126353 RepID=A0A2T3HMN2_9SPHI|nr:potassium-transporting ATPase subunit KdpC [Pedobacter yulinensis]PST83689.1 potassium-transporting ATPase subunit C [Pedobacter yulinensis]